MDLLERWTDRSRCDNCHEVGKLVAASLFVSGNEVGWVCTNCKQFSVIHFRIPRMLILAAKPLPSELKPKVSIWAKLKAWGTERLR